MNAEISPVPGDEEAVAIVAAVEALWPKPMAMAGDQNPLRTPTWRFSARWWAKPLPARRDRPFR
jgi:hypothetical protein